MINEFLGKTFNTREEMFGFIRANKSLIKQIKKSTFKKADGIGALFVSHDEVKKLATKSETNAPTFNTEQYSFKAVINACGYLDSHRDVHISGLWKKSISESKGGLHLQEHEMEFDKVVSDTAKVFTANIAWRDLGYDYEGTTECLIHDVLAEVKRNPFMADQYANGWVKQHSVGMRYVNYIMCINSESKMDEEEKANWDKYYPMVVNKESADETGYFWAVLEAKYVEGSAVVRGSNPATPTFDFQMIEPDTSTQDENKTEPVNMPLKTKLFL